MNTQDFCFILKQNSHLLREGSFGLEKENVRVNQDGTLALTPHPAVFGDKGKHPYITTDFSESQVEMITPPLPSVGEALGFMETLHEVVTVYLHEEWHLSRKTAAWLTTAATAALASLASLSLGVLSGWTICGLSLFDSLDFLTANILLPAGGFFTCGFVGWKLDRQILRDQITNNGELKFRFYGVFIFLLRYVCPAVLLLIFLDNLGVF